jgi:hypothetical protein
MCMAASRARDYLVTRGTLDKAPPSAPVQQQQISLLLRRVSRPERCCARGCFLLPIRKRGIGMTVCGEDCDGVQWGPTKGSVATHQCLSMEQQWEWLC